MLEYTLETEAAADDVMEPADDPGRLEYIDCGLMCVGDG